MGSSVGDLRVTTGAICTILCVVSLQGAWATAACTNRLPLRRPRRQRCILRARGVLHADGLSGSAPLRNTRLNSLFSQPSTPLLLVGCVAWSGCRNRVSARAGQRCRRSAPAPWYKGWRICAPAGACSCSCSLLLLLLFPSSFSSNPSVVTIQPPVARAFRNTVCLAHAAGPRSWSAAPVWVPNFRVYTARGSPRRDGG